MITLDKHQVEISDEAVEKLREYMIVYLSMEVRTGKTLTSLATADKYLEKHLSKVLFVTRKKAISSIESDYTRLRPKFDLFVTNYEQLHNIKENFDLVIVDEAHNLGQYPKPSNRTKLLKKICTGKPIIYLSGTPTPESYSQLYHQFWISDFSPFADYTNFYKWAEDYVDKKIKFLYNRQVNDYSYAYPDMIHEDTGHLFISFTQEEAGFEQLVQEEILRVKMKETTYKLVDKLCKHRVHIGRDGEELIADTEVKLMQKVHQIFSGTVILEDGRSVVFDRSKALSIRENFKDKKIAIFYKFQAEELMLISVFGHDRITKCPDEFNSSDDLIFACQVQSGREGINLATADCIVMLNIDFAAVSYWQSRARLQSKNRTKEAVIYWIFSENGIEDRIYQTVMNKKDYTLSYFRKDYNLKKKHNEYRNKTNTKTNRSLLQIKRDAGRHAEKA